jgi:hypothetical protein
LNKNKLKGNDFSSNQSTGSTNGNGLLSTSNNGDTSTNKDKPSSTSQFYQPSSSSNQTMTQAQSNNSLQPPSSQNSHSLSIIKQKSEENNIKTNNYNFKKGKFKDKILNNFMNNSNNNNDSIRISSNQIPLICVTSYSTSSSPPHHPPSTSPPPPPPPPFSLHSSQSQLEPQASIAKVIESNHNEPIRFTNETITIEHQYDKSNINQIRFDFVFGF